MDTILINTNELKNFVDAVIKDGAKTYGVVDKDFGKFDYAALNSAKELRLDFDVTLTPPKKFLSPAKETILKYKMAPKVEVASEFNAEKSVIIGVHPYDMVAINQMDEVWKETHEDAHYFQRRKNTIIIGVNPQKATKWSFWCLMETAFVDSGYDIWLTKLDNKTYFVEAATDAGKKLIKKYAKATPATEKDIARRDEVRSSQHNLCNIDRKLKVAAGEIPALVKENWKHPIWEEKAEKCYSCGSCNLICPTCYCFDVKDDFELNLKDGKRVRVWDGCQLENFAAVGSGENFREERAERFKHRFYRKTVYQFEKYGHLACVGCGRCSSVCLPDIADPVKILNELKEGK